MAEVNMPKLSDTMEEGTVLAWRKESGEHVAKGEPIAEIETDKASFEIEADAEGVLQIVVEAGKPVPVGAVIGQIEAAGSAQPAAAKAEGPQPAPPAPPAPEEESGDGKRGQAGGDERAPDETPDELEPTPTAPTADLDRAARDGEPGTGSRVGREHGGLKASPLARRLAQELDVDLRTLRGTGPEGRIVKEDVLAAAAAPGTAASPPAGRDGAELLEPTRMQAAIARRMTQSKQTVPHFYVTVEVRVDRALEVRAELKATVPAAESVSITDLLVRACALALRKMPDVNASWVDDRIQLKRQINIGVAVAQPRGLIVPVIRDADRKDVIAISIEGRQLIERARAGRLAQQDLEGGTFSISNLGMYGVDEFNAIINPPEAAILAVGGIKTIPVIDDGGVKAGRVIRLTLSVDHRVFYGATAAEFLGEVKRFLENPVSLVLPPES